MFDWKEDPHGRYNPLTRESVLVSFPHTMGLHQLPTDGSLHAEWHLHIHFDPPLLRSATGAEIHGRL